MKELRNSYLFFLLLIFISNFIYPFVLMPEWLSEPLMQYTMLFIPVVLFMLLTKKNFKSTLRLNPITLKMAGILTLITVVMQPFIGMAALVGSWIFGNKLEMLMSGFEHTPLWLYVFMVVITPAICEELVLRGVMLDAAASNMTAKKAIIMNGFLFGIFHMNFNQFSYTIFMGMILAYVVLRTGSIYASVLVHFVNNGLSVMMEKMNTDILFPVETLSNQFGPFVGSVLTFLLAIVSVFVTIKLLKWLPAAKFEAGINELHEQETTEEPENVAVPGLTGYCACYWPVAVSSVLFLLSSVLIMMM